MLEADNEGRRCTHVQLPTADQGSFEVYMWREGAMCRAAVSSDSHLDVGHAVV